MIPLGILGAATLRHTGADSRVSMTVSPQAESLAGFPVYVDLSTLPLDFWELLAFADGRDIRAKDALGADLPMHLVRVNPGNKSGSLFVRLDLSDTADTTFYLHFGNSGRSAIPDDAPNGRNAVWSDYHRVYLFPITQGSATGVGSALSYGRNFRFGLESQSPPITAHQGVCSDGSYYYIVDTNSLEKYDLDWNLVATNPNPLGDIGNGTNHCGDPDIYDGVLYVPAENYSSVSVFSNQRIARFNVSDLSFIDSIDVSAQGDEVATIAIDVEASILYTGSYKTSGFRLNKYELGTLAWIEAINGTSALSLMQGLTKFKGMWYGNSDEIDTTMLLSSDFGSAVRQWTDIPDSASTRSGNYEGLGSTPDNLLVLRDNGADSVVHVITPLDIEAGGGMRVCDSPDGVGRFIDGSVTNYNIFTIGVSAIFESVGANNQAVLSYTLDQTANTNRVTIAYRAASGKIGVWDTGNSWLESGKTPVVGSKQRIHVRYDGAVSRDIFVDGVKTNQPGIIAAPVSKTALYMGAEDATLGESFVGSFGFIYLRSGVLSDAWINAECYNLQSPSVFVVAGEVTPL